MKTILCALTFSGTLLVLFLFPAAALSVVVLDQAHEPPITPATIGFANVGAGNTVAWGQTFTVGVDGKLTAVDVLVAKDPAVTQPLLFDIRTVSGEVPSLADAGPNILASGSLAASFVPSTAAPGADTLVTDLAWVQLDIPDLDVTASTMLALVLRSNDPGSGPGITYSWATSDTPGYADGKLALRSSPDPWSGAAGSGYDMAFRTYVEVPEPTTLALAAFAILCGQFLRRRPRPQ